MLGARYFRLTFPLNSMTTKKENNTRGFTLIELLVVISVISILASVMIAQLNESRIKAQNSYTIQTISEYVKALELAYHDNGEYPRASGSSGVEYNYHCLGQAPNGTYCISSGFTENSGIENILSNYMPTLPSPNPSLVDYGPLGLFSGSTYRCDSSGCNVGYKIQWLMEGDVDCGPGTDTLTSGPLESYTWCQLTN